MRRYVAVALFAFAAGLGAQEVGVQEVGVQEAPQQTQKQPSPDELAFARLPQEVQGLLAGLTAREALQKYDYARQNLIALGTPNPSPERVRAQVEAVLAPRYTSIQSYSAGATSFPPLSPLVPASSFEYR